MNTRRFSRHLCTCTTPRGVSLILVWALLASLIPLKSATGQAPSQTLLAAVPSFTTSNIGVWQLNGSAEHIDGAQSIRLTPTNSSSDTAGSAFYKQAATLGENRSFSAYFAIAILNPGSKPGFNPPGGDGMVFTLQNASDREVRDMHMGLGYKGMPGRSIGIEFDTWDNGTNEGDPSDNHVGLNLDGTVRSTITASPPASLEGNTWHVWIEYNGATSRLELRMSQANHRPTDALLTYNNTLKDHIPGNPFFGFTAATGLAWQNHEIKSFYFSNTYIPNGIRTSSLDVNTDRAEIENDGQQSAAIIATVRDLNSRPLPGETVHFRTTLGSLSAATATTDEAGRARVSLTSDVVGTAIIDAKAPGGAAGQVQVLVKDTRPPEPPIVLSPAIGGVTNDSTPQFDGIAERGSTVIVKHGDKQLCGATTGSNGGWICTPSEALINRDYTVSVTAHDASGNSSTPTAHSFTVDTAASPSIFTRSRNFGVVDDETGSLAVGDLDNDGDLDLVIGAKRVFKLNLIRIVAYFNDGRGQFSEQWSHTLPGSESIKALSVADFNNDGGLDIVAGNTIYLNDRAGNFTQGYQFDISLAAITSVAVGDVNGDRSFDVVIGAYGRHSKLYLNDGTGQFPNSRDLELLGSQTMSVALGDVNGDSHLDIAVGTNGGQNRIALNDGADTFSSFQDFGTASGSVTTSLFIADVNDDGLLDIIAGKGNPDPQTTQRPEQSVIYVNRGGGAFHTGPESCATPSLLCIGSSEQRTNSVVAGDVDTDGDVDVFIANHDSSAVYLNNGRGDFTTSLRISGTSPVIESAAFADVDQNGHLDLVAGGVPYKTIFLNSGAGHVHNARLFGGDTDSPLTTAVGDMNGDGHLDIVAGYDRKPGQIFFNDGRGGFYRGAVDCTAASTPASVTCFGTGSNQTTSILVADLDGDRDQDLVTTHMDLVAGSRASFPYNLQPNTSGAALESYINDGTGAFTASRISDKAGIHSLSAAIGDLNGDTTLDLIVAQVSVQSGRTTYDYTARYEVFTKNQDGQFSKGSLIGGEAGYSTSVALGDLDRDGDLDLVAANIYGKSKVYLNNGAAKFEAGGPIGGTAESSLSVALGDFDRDGDLDIAGNHSGQNMVSFNDGTGRFPSEQRFGPPTYHTTSLVVADVDGNGSLDLIAGNATIVDSNKPCCVEPSAVYLSHPGVDGAIDFSAVRSLGERVMTVAVAVGDLDGNGATDIVAARKDAPSAIYLNTIHHPTGLTSNPPHVKIARPVATKEANFYSTTELITTTTIPITYTLFGENHDLVNMRVFYSLNGGGLWRPAVTASGTNTTTGTSSPTGRTYTYLWDTFASSMFGTSQNVLVRIEASSAQAPRANSPAGPYQRPYLAAQTFPFRVRGTQIRVLNGTAPASGAVVYRLPKDHPTGGSPFGVSGGSPLLTDQDGYLPGHGEIERGDQLLALVTVPISSTDDYTLYYTNGKPNARGISAYTVTQGGLQLLTVSSEHPLLLFHLDVSLEWNAHSDTTFLEQLKHDLKRTSQHLYDFTDGQIALGTVTLHQNRDRWTDADIAIHRTNNLRPYTSKQPGRNKLHPGVDQNIDKEQVHIGVTWSDGGIPGGSLGEDWSLILAHELGHSLLSLDDTYLGLTDTQLLTIVSSCTGSAMGNVYRSENTEFVWDRAHWESNCAATLANRYKQRTEWETIQQKYSHLKAPSSARAANPGPSSMPFDLTHIHVKAPTDSTTVLENPHIIINRAGNTEHASPARAFLIPQDQPISDLGKVYKGQNRVTARGAKKDDRFCLFDRSHNQLGCTVLKEGNQQVNLKRFANWSPLIKLTAATSKTFTVTVDLLPPGLDLKARLFPALDLPTKELRLKHNPNGSYTSDLITLDDSSWDGHVQVWVDEPATEADPRREAIVSYAVGGRPGHAPPSDAPLMSSDGQMIFFTPDPDAFQQEHLFTIQGMDALPPLPVGKKLVGQGYHLIAQGGAQLPPGSISFQYLQQDALATQLSEHSFQIHHWDGVQWRVLQTEHNKAYNFTSAPSAGPGIYALLGGATAPTITSFDPKTATRDSTTTLTITGTEFLLPSKVELLHTTRPMTVELTVESSMPTTIKATVPAGLPEGLYQVRVTNGDQQSGLAADRLALYPPAGATCFADSFGSGASQWEVSGDWGIVDLPNGQYAMTDSPNRSYSNATDKEMVRHTSITSKPFDLDPATCPHPMLTFRHDYVFARHGANQDTGVVQITRDGGLHWETLARFSGGRLYGADGTVLQTAGSSEWSDAEWKNVQLDLSRYLDHPASLQLRFVFAADRYAADRGWIIDDLAVQTRYALFIPIGQ